MKLPLLLRAGLLAGLGRGAEPSPIQQSQGVRRVLGDRTNAYDTSSLTCLVTPGATTFDSNTVLNERSYHDFEFWYALGVKVESLSYEEMFQVERVLFMAIKNDLLWCWQEDSPDMQATTKTVSVDNKDSNRALQQRQKERFAEEARKLGIIAFSQGGMDQQKPQRKLLRFR